MVRMDLRQKRQAYLETAGNILNTAQRENRNLSAAETRDVEGLHKKADDLWMTIQVAERQGEAEARAGAASRNSGGAHIESEFRDIGELVLALRDKDPKIFSLENRSLSMSGSGGYLVPEGFREQLLAIGPEGAIVRPRAMVLPAGDPPDAAISIPALAQGANGRYAGVSLSWISEGDTKPETTPGLTEVSLTPNEVAAHVVVTDKLLRNSPAAAAIINRLFRSGLSAEEDACFLTGDGVGKPQGVLSANCTIAVNRAGAGAVAFEDVAKMVGRLLPESMQKAVWVANVTVLPQLIEMTAGGVSVNSAVWLGGDASRTAPSTLLGMPIIFTGKTPVLGTKGDLMLCDFSYYLIKNGAGPFISASEHVYFTANKTVIKAFSNVDGAPWPAAPLTLEDGSTTVSPFVVLN